MGSEEIEDEMIDGRQCIVVLCERESEPDIATIFLH